MAVLERVMQLKQNGLDESQIIRNLQEQGVSPKEINDAISQSKIKYEIYNSQNNAQNSYSGYEDPNAMQQEYAPDLNDSQMQPSMNQSMMEKEASPELNRQQNYQKSGELENPPRENYAPEQNEQYEAPLEDYTAPQNAQEYYPEYQPEYQEYQPSAGIDIETINEVAEQIVEEKQDKIKKEMSSFSKFKEEITFDVQRMNARLEKIEKTIDELQIAILRRIGDYGRDIQNISKELHATQNSFSKIIDPLTDNIRELQKITGEISEKDFKKENSNKDSENKQKKSKDEFDNYLLR